MAIYNVNGHGISFGVSASDKGLPSSPYASPVQAHSAISELKSITSAPISSEQRRLVGDLNIEARKLAATDRSVGSLSKAITDCAVGDEERARRLNHINDKSSLFARYVGGGSFLKNPGLRVMEKEGEIKKCFLGRTSAGGPETMFEDRGELGAGEELGPGFGPTELHVVEWTGLGNNIYQHIEAEESETNTSLSGQLSPNRSRKFRKPRNSGKLGLSLAKGKASKQKKASQTTGRKWGPRLRVVSRSPLQ
ncbi:hypothetical protein Ancab_004710 [Ancistrocladus abbreviatus]